MKVSAQFGKLAMCTSNPLDPGENEIVILKLEDRSVVLSGDQSHKPRALATGRAALEWVNGEWTDGQARNLVDFTEKVFVLDFLGVWCEPCIQAIPVMSELHDRYIETDVAFLAFLTAGTDMTLVKRLLKQKRWGIVADLDSGDEIASEETVGRFSFFGYPSILIISRNGIIAFNGSECPSDLDAYRRESEAVAASSGIPWPIEVEASGEEFVKRLTQLQTAMLSRLIDKAIETVDD